MYSLLFALVMQVASPGGQPPAMDIVVPASSATGTLQNMGELVRKLQPKPKPGFDESRRTGPGAKSFLEFMRPHEPTRIVVDRYSPASGPGFGKGVWTESSLKSELQAVMTARMEGMFSQAVWSELYIWSVAATLTFKDGTQGKILLDGMHGCYEDPEGYRWFFRYQVKRTE